MNFRPNDIIEMGIILLCLVLSGLFSASETAITSLGVMKARHLLDQKGKSYAALKTWLKHPERILTTILIFNTLVNILASALATDLAVYYIGKGGGAIEIATFVTTAVVVVFSEVIPKAFARANYKTLAKFCMTFVNIFYRLSYPVVWFLSEFAKFIIKRFGSEESMHPVITEDELEFFVEEGEKAGVLKDIKKNMISAVFDFDETKAREIMTPRTDILAIEKESGLNEAIELILQSGHSRLPVYEERIDNIVGIVFAKDILRYLATRESKDNPPTLPQIMREPLFVPESKPLMGVFKDLKRTKNHMAVVIDEYGGTAGIVTMEDTLEEIVGDIQDEFDSEEAKILEIDKGVYDIAGSVNISEFMEFFELEDIFESEDIEGEVDTVGGWVTHLLEDLPEVGQTLTYKSLTIEVTEITRHRIERVRVVKMLTPASADEEEGEH
ncbi:MAG: HlyC/CorC family transporter [Oligoflexales bacterium]|nr:HlyC/CorC family transporter [Oligoflexales bacterium]